MDQERDDEHASESGLKETKKRGATRGVAGRRNGINRKCAETSRRGCGSGFGDDELIVPIPFSFLNGARTLIDR